MKRSRSPVDEDFVDEGRPTFKLSRGTSKFVLHRNRAFLTQRQSKRSWRLDFWARKCLKKNRHFDDRQSWESVQEFTQVCTTEWIAFRRSGQEWIICGVQNLVKSWTALNTCSGSDYISTKDELQLLCWWTVQWTLVWTFPPLCLLHMYFTNVSTCHYVINLEQLHFGLHLHVIRVKFSFSKCSLLRHAA